MSGQIAIVCTRCGGDDVSRDAWANWDVKAQEWVLGAVFDYAHCHRCDGETSLIDAHLDPGEGRPAELA